MIRSPDMIEPADGYAQLPVAAAWDETPVLRAIAVELGARAAEHRAPGQVMKARLDGHEGYFALATAPGAARAELLVKRGSPLADALVAAAQPGAAVSLAGPMGTGFPLAVAQGRDVMLFAAGAGIAPIRALIQHVVAHRDGFGRVALFYGQRGHDDFAYRAEHGAWHAAGVRVVLCPSQPAEGWEGPSGYVQDVAHALGFLELATEGAVAYLAGMREMVSGVRAVLERAGVAAERVFLNY